MIEPEMMGHVLLSVGSSMPPRMFNLKSVVQDSSQEGEKLVKADSSSLHETHGRHGRIIAW